MTIIIAFSLLLTGVISFNLIIKKISDASIKASPPHTPPQRTKNPETEFKEILNILLKLNLMIRKDANFSQEMTLMIESIIDHLRQIIPVLMTDHPEEALTHESKEIGRTYLYKLVKVFLGLSREKKIKHLTNFNNNIRSLKELLQESREIIETNETPEFKTLAKALANLSVTQGKETQIAR
jgi:hypothetical protein